MAALEAAESGGAQPLPAVAEAQLAHAPAQQPERAAPAAAVSLLPTGEAESLGLARSVGRRRGIQRGAWRWLPEQWRTDGRTDFDDLVEVWNRPRAGVSVAMVLLLVLMLAAFRFFR